MNTLQDRIRGSLIGGAITGNILGAAIGYEAIPQHFKDDVELHDVILHMADDLYRGEATKME